MGDSLIIDHIFSKGLREVAKGRGGIKGGGYITMEGELEREDERDWEAKSSM